MYETAGSPGWNICRGPARQVVRTLGTRRQRGRLLPAGVRMAGAKRERAARESRAKLTPMSRALAPFPALPRQLVILPMRRFPRRSLPAPSASSAGP